MNKSIKLIFNYLLAPVLFIVLSWSLYQQIANQPDLSERWAHIKVSWQNILFWVAFILMFINWGIEARKWQLLISPLEKFTFLTSVKSVLAGCSVTMLTPNRIGEYGGRILYVEESQRLKAISVTILGSMSQLLVTLVMGTCGLLLMRFFPQDQRLFFDTLPWILGNVLLTVSIGFSIIMIMLYMKIRFFLNLLLRIHFLSKLVDYIKVLEVFSGKQLLRILFLSLSRYIVFILQYVLLLNVMEVEVSIVMCFWLLTIFYLVMAVAPTIGFLELPVRAAISLELFRRYSINIAGIQAAALGIWLINLVIPAMIGSVLIFGIKILKDR
ncbi:MAG: lysylphosphatidylglycerol synthase domain-containing protein [Ferruginibacter sp.]